MNRSVQIGVDEAGTGAWFGPFVVCCVALPAIRTEYRDSKRCTPLKREVLRRDILSKALSVGIRVVGVQEMETGYYAAWRKAVLDVSKHVIHRVGASTVILDGSPTVLVRQDFARAGIDLIHETRADDKYQACSAASILAKTTRDFLMQCYDARYPEYGFRAHKGYGTAQHREALKKYGYLAQHRSRGRQIGNAQICRGPTSIR